VVENERGCEGEGGKERGEKRADSRSAADNLSRVQLPPERGANIKVDDPRPPVRWSARIWGYSCSRLHRRQTRDLCGLDVTRHRKHEVSRRGPPLRSLSALSHPVGSGPGGVAPSHTPHRAETGGAGRLCDGSVPLPCFADTISTSTCHQPVRMGACQDMELTSKRLFHDNRLNRKDSPDLRAYDESLVNSSPSCLHAASALSHHGTTAPRGHARRCSVIHRSSLQW
jgi:hypothetical protein